LSPWRVALLGGLIYAVPYAVWLVGGLEPSPSPPDLRAALPALLWAQLLALAVFQPALAGRTPLATAGAALGLLAVPWPLLVLVASTGSVAVWDLARTQASVGLLAIAIALLWHLGARFAPAWRRPFRGGAQALVLLALGIGLRNTGGWL
jgi:hypothetical protein